jgi:dipeptidyl aminopeptidase/acylaminoacyl peptidase
MKKIDSNITRPLLIVFFWLAFNSLLFGQENPVYSQKEVIYGRKDGMALTMLVLTPKVNANGRGIISLTSSGWYSSYQDLPRFLKRAQPLLIRGYTVFIIFHGSVPKYTIPEMVTDIRQSIRFVRFNATAYGIVPDKLGITGGSAGGHLSLLLAVADEPPVTNTADPVSQLSSRVQAVACFHPPTDLLNWSKPGEALVLDKPRLAQAKVRPAFEFTQWSETEGMLVPINDVKQQLEISKQLSPLYHVTPDDAPVLIAHGDADRSVPLQQSQKFIEKLQQNRIPNKLLIRKGADHYWPDEEVELEQFADWFDKYLK